MLDPRIYRMGLISIALAVVVVAFSLQNQPGALGTSLAPVAFNGQDAYTTMQTLAQQYPQRRPGTAGDDALASYVGQQFRSNGFGVDTRTFTARTADGTRTLETVTGTRVGLSSGSIVVVAHRDSLASPATADLSGTATLIDLANVLAGETQNRTIVLASISGSVGAAGAQELARSLGRPVDAVIVLGDLAGTHVREPVVVPWSNGQRVAPPLLRNTVAAALGAQAALRPGGTSIAGQFTHLAFPLTISEQGPFGTYGEPAVLVSVSGERSPSASEPTSQAQITAMGQAVLTAVSALDGGPSIPAPSAYLLFDGKVVPVWAVRLLVLALILPVLGATVDGLARARRRGHRIFRWLVWVLAGGLPFVLAFLVVLGARASGFIAAAPPGPVGSGVVPLHAAGAALLAALVLVVVVSFIALRPFVIRAAGVGHGPEGPANAGAGTAVLLLMCSLALAIWVENPFAAALVVPALHLWMWVVDPELRLRPAHNVALVAVGLLPPILVVLYYAVVLGLSPLAVVWSGALLFAGGQVGPLVAVEWSLMLGCVASVVMIAARVTREDREHEVPVTVRGPVSYAGPGSLGGTESALRR